MSWTAAGMRPRRPRLAHWRSRLSTDIFATSLAIAGLTMVAAFLPVPFARAAAPEAGFWLRLAGTALLASAVAVTLGALLARQVADPVAELLRVVDAGWERHARDSVAGARMTAPEGRSRADEIGQLSIGVERLLAALSDRVAANENFAADIAHEVRNPLASLRSAAEALRRSDDEQRPKLLDIVDQDVARLDRLLGEIASSCRLDAELVREQAIEFDLLQTVRSLVTHLSIGAEARGVDLICDVPDGPVHVLGLEPRLVQVVVNLVENAISLCEDGDAVRVWVRRRDQRVLIVVEDTGPGIPDGEAEKIFRRFYSYRPEAQFGANSGLGLAISRQIVEAHDGVIWAENIRPTESDLLSEPLGARFVVVLPL